MTRGQKIRQLRTDQDLTQVALAAKLKRPQSWVSRLESGETSCSVDDLQAVAQALGVEVAELAVLPRVTDDSEAA